MQRLVSRLVVSASDLGRAPTRVFVKSGGEPVGVLDRNRVLGYFVPPEVYESIVDRIDDAERARSARERRDDAAVASRDS